MSRFEIALKTNCERKLPANIRTTIELEYAANYLESIGVRPSKDNVELIQVLFMKYY